jgi:acetyl-CoA carboxylase biotin carboxyl carrier protein
VIRPRRSAASRGESTLPDIEQIRELIQLMKENDIAEVSIKNGDDMIELKRVGASNPMVWPSPLAMHPAGAALPPAAPAPPVTGEVKAEDEKLVPILSPMVGTFYAAPDPNSPPYVTIGSEVTEDTVVCIVEAMKVFNEIKSEVNGTIAKILVANETGVDYGQPMFLVQPR